MRKERRKTNIWKVAAVVAIVLSLNQVVVGAPRYKVLHYFSGTDGVGPYGGVTADQEGNLYGASDSGGSGGCDGYGCGLIFELKRGKMESGPKRSCTPSAQSAMALYPTGASRWTPLEMSMVRPPPAAPITTVRFSS
jgi:hypothetical protein